MIDTKDEFILETNEYPIIIEDECSELKPILKDFIETYAKNSSSSIDMWLSIKLHEYLSDKSNNYIKKITNEIINAIEIAETKKISLSESVKKGRSKESWFASEVKKATSSMSSHDTIQYLDLLDKAVNEANESLYHTITTQSGAVNQNPRLDGFIAEQYHVQTFNMNAEALGSKYRAKVLEPKLGETYKKNSVDIVVNDENGKIVRRYQSKYCKDAVSTEQAFRHGDYRGQRKLVPYGQEAAISKKSCTYIEAPDGTKSNPLSKNSAERMRDEAQSGNWNELNWNEYQVKDIAIGIGKNIGYSALQGAAIGVGYDIAKKIWDNQEIHAPEIVETALKSGADFGIKAATAGALKVGVEKGIISVIPKGTPATVLANIAFVAIEDAKVIGKIFMGDISIKEGIEKIGQTTVSTAAGLLTMGKGVAVGAAIGTVFGPIGTAIGGFVGGTVGYLAGSKTGDILVKGAKKLCNSAKKVLGIIGDGLKMIGNSISEKIRKKIHYDSQ